MTDDGPISSRLTTYRLLQGFRGSIDDPPLRKLPSGKPEWHMCDDHAMHLATSKGDSAQAITSAMRVVIDRGDFGTGGWFLVTHGEYEFRLNNIDIALRAQASRHYDEMDHGGE